MAQFEVFKNKKGEFQFRLQANNRETIAISEGYKTKAKAIKTIGVIKAIAATAEVVEAEPAPAKAAKKTSKK